jgi:unsaturated chondroitin disaccharide hydrolase
MHVCCTSSFPYTFADFMINIQMLVWGAQHVGGPAQDLRMDPDPAATWMNMAQEHARQVAKNHMRPDGSTYHIVEYNPNTGVLLEGQLLQLAACMYRMRKRSDVAAVAWFHQ